MSIRSHARAILLCGLAMASNCFAATVFVPIPTNSVDVSYTPTGYTSPVTITGHGASGNQVVPGWTWNYTGDYSDPRYPMYMSSGQPPNPSYACLGPQTGISVPYACNSDDNLTSSPGNDYPGYEFHYFVFELPAGAQSPRINFNALGSDDRAVVTLNGYELGNFASPATDQPHLGPAGTSTRTFTLPSSDQWFDDPTLFRTGSNILRLWVNNTGSGGYGTAKTHAGGGGPSGSVVRGFLTYDYTEQEHHVLAITKLGLGSGEVASEPPGIACGNYCSSTFKHGQIVTLLALPYKGSTFTGWSGAGCSGTSDCLLTMNGPKIVSASFYLLPPFGDVDPNGWAAGYIYALRNEGLTSGCGDGANYCPKDFVTREQMAAFIIRALEGDPDENYCFGIPPYLDVDAESWSCPYILRLQELGITGGCGNDKYCPKNLVTREQMAVFIIRALEGNPPTGYCQGLPAFNDVPASSWACGHILRLYELGITQGCGNDNYCPSKIVTREEMAAFLARAFLGMD